MPCMGGAAELFGGNKVGVLGDNNGVRPLVVFGIGADIRGGNTSGG